MSNALSIITGDINATKDEFLALLADKSISFEREAGFALQVLGNNSYALGVASNNRPSLLNAVKNIAAIGISLNPAKKQAYLVPRGGAICLDISYMGLMDLAMATGSILWGQAKLVRENDNFRLRGLDQLPNHEHDPFSKDRGAIVGVYVVVKTKDGDYLTHTMNIGEVYDIRDRSESWKSFQAKKAKSSPWSTDPGEMIKKTCVKQASKYWPKTDRLDAAIHHLNTDGGEGLQDLNAKPDNWIDVEPLIAQALATRTDADALAFWKANNAALVSQPQCHKKLKEVIAGHRARMKADDEARTVEMQQTEPAQDAAPAMSDEELDLQRSAGAA